LPLNQVSLAEYDKALETARQAARLAPESGTGAQWMMASYIALDRLDEAKTIYGQSITKFPDLEFLHEERYQLAFLQKDEAIMQQQMDWAKTQHAPLQLLWAPVNTAVYGGRLEEARRLASPAEQRATASGSPELAALMRAELGLYELELGNAEAARFQASQALQLSPSRDATIVAALTLARSGDAAQAEKLAAKLNQQFPLDTIMQSYWLPTLRGAIALQRNNPQQAIAALEAALPYELGNQTYLFVYPVYVRGLAYLKANQGEQAQAEFNKFLQHPGIVKNCPMGALAVLQLARAQTMSGDTKAARKTYQDFLALWNKADENIPILKEARAEYARLP
jgi:tetratricopeptide (TPR) repeat protein